MRNLFKKVTWVLPGLVLGAVGGYFYWKFYGCDGTCLITSSPVRTMAYFGLMGALLNSTFNPKSTNETAGNN